jgi:hypothetical protein
MRAILPACCANRSSARRVAVFGKRPGGLRLVLLAALALFALAVDGAHVTRASVRTSRAPVSLRSAQRRASVAAVVDPVDAWAPAIMIPVVGPYLQAKLGFAGDAINWAIQLLFTVELVYLIKEVQGRILYAFQGPGEPLSYDDLAGRPETLDSWAAEAAVNALAGVVPVQSADGFAIATFAGGCFW